jgi:hypothetical protein
MRPSCSLRAPNPLPLFALSRAACKFSAVTSPSIFSSFIALFSSKPPRTTLVCCTMIVSTVRTAQDACSLSVTSLCSSGWHTLVYSALEHALLAVCIQHECASAMQEMKKIRKQRREEREQEKQRNIQVGLLEPPKDKVRLSNMPRVYGADGVVDATAIEMKVREAQQEREAAHRDRNLARALTTEERRDKKLKRMFDDSAEDTQVQVCTSNLPFQSFMSWLLKLASPCVFLRIFASVQVSM